MNNDPRCCGTGTCIINEEGLCWCGQTWDGEKMCFLPSAVASGSENTIASDKPQRLDETDLMPATVPNRP